METDIAIIGAGLAGLSAAATIAARSRAMVVVVERHVVGSNNPTPLVFEDVPRKYGLEECVIGGYHRLTIQSPAGNCSSHQFEATPLVTLAYRQACLTLFDRACTAGNVWEYSGTASGLQRQADGKWRLHLSDGMEIVTRLVIDASGRGLFSARALGLPQPGLFSHQYGGRFMNAGLPDLHEAFLFAPSDAYGNGGGWFFPLDYDQASFGFSVLGARPSLPGKAVKANFQRALAELEPFASWLKAATWDRVEVGAIPLDPLKRLVYDGLIIAGDAAGQAGGLWLQGSEAALLAGEMAGEAALVGLKRNNFSARSLSGYQSGWQQLSRKQPRTGGRPARAAGRLTLEALTPEAWNSQIALIGSWTPAQMLASLQKNRIAPRPVPGWGRASSTLAKKAIMGLAGRKKPVKAADPKESKVV